MSTLSKVATWLAFAICSCQAVAVPTTTGDSGYRNDIVNVFISELDPTNLFGVQLRIDYSLDNLELVSTSTGDIGNNFLLATIGDYIDPSDPFGPPVPGSLSASLSIPTVALTAADGGSLFQLTFKITPGAAFGPTDVWFSCDDFGLGRPCLDYDFDPVPATITVLQRATNPMPLPGTLPLLGVGGAALLWARRRKR